MTFPKFIPSDSPNNLRKRVAGLLVTSLETEKVSEQIELPLFVDTHTEAQEKLASFSAADFLNLIADATMNGDVYLFGGLLRDLALFGKKGFNSDIDIVVEGNWQNLIPFLEHLGAKRNKFGGYRLIVDAYPVDIWNARETWAIRQGQVPYSGIASLTDTTVLNWDAILMNWRTKNFIFREHYFEEIAGRFLDVVLMENPNPKGMAVRVFRHLCHKDARKISVRAIKYLAECTERFSFLELHRAEKASYGIPIIDENIYKLFKYTNLTRDLSIENSYSSAGHILAQELNLVGQ